MLALTVRYNSNTRAVKRSVPQAGDIIEVIYDVVIAPGPNAYPLGGEPVSFAGEFREVHDVRIDPVADEPAAGMATAGAFVGRFQRAAGAAGLNTGVVRLFATGAAAQAKLEELAAGVYATALAGRIIVHGRPSTDAV